MKNYNDTLEFYKIINKLIDNSFLNETKEKFLDLKLYTNKDLLEKELKLMQSMIDFYKYDDGFELTEIFDISNQIKSLSMLGSYIELIDLFHLKKDLILYRKCKSRAKNVRDKYKEIWKIFSNDIEIKELENVIEDIVDDNGDIKDTASVGLKDIRKQKKLINENIKDKLDSIINEPKTSKAVDQKIITKRNDRYVIPVKTDFKGLIKGIEHDRSSTGNSVYIEPISVVSLNNKLREYETREREEIRKILIRISEYIRVKLDDIKHIFEIILTLDFLNSKTLFSLKYECEIPNIVNKEMINLVNARHPLIPKENSVPISFNLDEDKIMLITGPNTGGKTVTLKITGLLTIMALSGIPIPASEKSTIGFFEIVLADIGDEQSIEQNLSSFSAHVKSISEILTLCNKKALILLDELGSGTDPMEGSAFAMAIIDYLNSKNIKSIITTHYSDVKAYAFNNKGIKSASMEFNIETLSPTYRLIEGIPGESNALIIAKKYGISDTIIQNAKSYISEDNKKVEEMLTAIKQKNEELEEMNIKFKKLTQELEKEKQVYSSKILQLEKEKNDIIEKSHKEADEYLRNMQAKAKALVEKINKENANIDEMKQTQRNINMLANSIKEDKKKIKNEIKVEEISIDFELGEEVLIKSLNKNAKILKIIASKASAQVQAGILKLVVPFTDIVKISKKKENNTGKRFVSFKGGNTKMQIDVRGKNSDDALNEIEIYLDKAVLSGYNMVYIIHGKGTMVLRQKIREYLKTSVYVSNFTDANQNEGGLGCTIVNLK
ncbi:endonuclease MutS2 [Caviibacter abscessus]|uniref:endonuclease MutS2 n=1 Tax=Caviibacter abscessus TaxID=1766719 RepID=UPI0008374A5F|nr:endonuclease MutS2 [Caviibacter abscessus]